MGLPGFKTLLACPKCTMPRTNVSFRPPGIEFDLNGTPTKLDEECLASYCSSCGFGWITACADAPK